MATELMEIVVDQDLCRGHGKCYMLAPDFMQPRDDDDLGRAEFYGDPLSPDDRKTFGVAQVVVSSCPERAISWTSAGQPEA